MTTRNNVRSAPWRLSLFLSGIALVAGARVASSACSFTSMPSPNGTHPAIALSDPSGQQTAYFDLYWGGVLGSLKQGATERLWGNHPIGMVQPSWTAYPAGQPPASPYNPLPAGDVSGHGRPPMGAACSDSNTVTIMVGLTDFAAGGNGNPVLPGVVDGSIVAGLYAAPYVLTTVAVFVPNPTGTPSHYLRLQQRVVNASESETIAFALALRGSVPYGYTYTAMDPPACTTQTSCNSNATAYLVAGRYPNASLVGGTAFAIAPSSYWTGSGSQTWATFETDAANQNQRVNLRNTYWAVVPSTVPTSGNASRTWEWFVMVGDWISAKSFAARPRLWSVPSPGFGPVGGGTSLTVTGSKFAIGATFKLDNVAATNVTRLSAIQLQGTSPAHAAGAVDVTVTNPGGATDVLKRGYVYGFADVPTSNPVHDFVLRLARSGITAGCGSNNFCVNSTITRAQMSVFLVKAKYGAEYIPPTCDTTHVFADVACPSTYADWIGKLYVDGVTAGCGGNNFCPSGNVTRPEMAVFLGKTRFGSTFPLEAATGCVFSDVPKANQYAAWIELSNWSGVMGTTTSGSCNYSVPNGSGGCSTPASNCTFSLTTNVTRGDMARFMTFMFGLQ